MQEFVDFCVDLFPNISPYHAENVKEVIGKTLEEYNSISEKYPFLTTYNNQEITQGDIFSKIPFVYVTEDGQPQTACFRAQLLSNSCDIVRDDRLVFAAILPDEFEFKSKNFLDDVRKNIKYGYYCVPASNHKEYIIDFSLVASYPRRLFERFVSENKVHKIASLTNFGYYFFLTKLTIFYMRPESKEVVREGQLTSA